LPVRLNTTLVSQHASAFRMHITRVDINSKNSTCTLCVTVMIMLFLCSSPVLMQSLNSKNTKQGNRRLHFARAVHSRHPFSANSLFRKRGRDGMILVLHYVIGDPFCSERVIVHCQWRRKPLPANRRCGLSSTCRRRIETRTWTTCTKIW